MIYTFHVVFTAIQCKINIPKGGGVPFCPLGGRKGGGWGVRVQFLLIQYFIDIDQVALTTGLYLSIYLTIYKYNTVFIYLTIQAIFIFFPTYLYINKI